MHKLRKQHEFIFENADDDIEGHRRSNISPKNVSYLWMQLLNGKYGIVVKDLYLVDSTRKLIPPHYQTYLSKPDRTFTLYKGLLLFHVTIHEPTLDFKYPQNEPFFSTTPSHGLGIAFQEKRRDIMDKGHKARLLIFVLRKDLVCVDNCGDCSRFSNEAEATVSGYINDGNKGWENLNEIRIFKKTTKEVKECIEYVTEFDLTQYIINKSPFVNYDIIDTLHLFRNRDVIYNIPISDKFYKDSGWRPVTSQLSALIFMASLLYDDEFVDVPILFTISLFAVNQLWVLGEYDFEDIDKLKDIAMLILKNGVPKLLFLTQYIAGRKDDNKVEKEMLKKELLIHLELSN